MKISFCTTCMGRLHQLSKVLPKNLAVTEAYDVEFCLLNYNSPDDLHEWAKATLQHHIDSGRVVYAREATARAFHAPKAKNLAHLIATGDVLMNLDADNYVGNVIPWLHRYCHDWQFLHFWSGTWHDGTYGRIALTRRRFYELRGYNEAFGPICTHDINLIERARGFGLRYLRVPGRDADAEPNTKADTNALTGSRLTWDAIDRANRRTHAKDIRERRWATNPDGWGRATLDVNFQYTLTTRHP